jgi:hypothetical protein
MTVFRSRAVRVLSAVAVGLVATVVVPFGNLWLKCQLPTSEACVWSRAYLPLSLAFTAVVVGLPAFGLTLFLLRRYVATLSR